MSYIYIMYMYIYIYSYHILPVYMYTLRSFRNLAYPTPNLNISSCKIEIDNSLTCVCAVVFIF